MKEVIEMPTKTTTKTSPAEVHAQAVKAIGAWTAELDKARAELARLESTPAVDAATAKRQAAETAVAREYSYRCAHNLDAAIDRRDAAAAAVVEREAEDLQPEIDAAAAELAEHDRITKELLKPLREHSGRDWAAVDPVASWRARGGDGRVSVPVSARALLEGRLRAVERRQRALRTAAGGGDPVHVCPEDELPGSLLPGGIMPAPSLVEREAQAAEQDRAEQDRAALLAEAQRQVDGALEALGVRLDVTADQPSSEWTRERGRRWRDQYGATMTPGRQETVWADVDGWHARIVHLELIAGLAGWDAGTEAAEAAIPATVTAAANDTTGE